MEVHDWQRQEVEIGRTIAIRTPSLWPGDHSLRREGNANGQHLRRTLLVGLQPQQ